MEYTCKDAIEMLSDVATVFIAGIALYYAWRTYRVAKEAKDEWKNQKYYETDIELSSNLLEAITGLNRLNKTYYTPDELQDYQREILKDLSKFKDNHMLEVSCLSSGFANNNDDISNEITKIRQSAMKAKNYTRNNDFKNFYTKWLKYEAHIFTTILNYVIFYTNFYSNKHNYLPMRTDVHRIFNQRFELLLLEGYDEKSAHDLLFKGLANIDQEDDYKEMINIYTKYYILPNLSA